MHGWIFLDKPYALSSNHALSRVKRLLHQKKAGFSGTLDPLATGVLPIALGEALKTMHYMTFSTKAYRFEVTFGQERSTGDREGEVLKTSAVQPNAAQLAHVLSHFLGEISQTPPRYSAIKIEGKRACDRVRDGEDVVIKPRTVTIHTLTLEHDGVCTATPLHQATFVVECSAGTYVRSLAQDIAYAVGTVGYVSELRRIKVGRFEEKMTITLEKLEELVHSSVDLLPLHAVGIGLDDILAIDISRDDYYCFLMGKYVPWASVSDFGSETSENHVVQLRHQGKFLGFGTLEQGLLKPKRMINTNI